MVTALQGQAWDGTRAFASVRRLTKKEVSVGIIGLIVVIVLVILLLRLLAW
jgi:t-SNARE complex subunit (syntaxin)